MSQHKGRQELSCYDAWELKTVPTDVIVDAEGIVLGVHAGLLTSGEAEGLLKSAGFIHPSQNKFFMKLEKSLPAGEPLYRSTFDSFLDSLVFQAIWSFTQPSPGEGN